MKRAIFSLLAVAILAGLTGCVTQHGRRPWSCMGGSCAQAPENCKSCQSGEGSGENVQDPAHCRACGGLGCRLCRGGQEGEAAAAGPSGPPVGTVTYPYYTTRGPRDFLDKNPASIGP